jgi:DnaK suppressor protein
VTAVASEPAAGPEAALLEAQAATRSELAALERDLAGVMAASRESNADDEHDPEGATIAFERAQLVAIRDAAHRRLLDVEEALERLRAGRYGRCVRCGDEIGAERLAARPASTLCFSCAAIVG